MGATRDERRRRCGQRSSRGASAARACSLALAALGLAAGPARSSPDLLAFARPLSSVFHIAKSENHNQVHYAVRANADCTIKSKDPVYGYWRDLEEGPRVTSPLLGHEQPAYGLTRPRSIENKEQGGRVLFGLRGFPDRDVTIQTFRAPDGKCRAWAMTKIKGGQAILRSLYVELGFLFSIDYVLLRGTRISDGKPVQEKVED